MEIILAVEVPTRPTADSAADSGPDPPDGERESRVGRATGLCIRVPRSERPKLSDVPVEPFAVCYRQMSDANESLAHAQEVGDYQWIGVRCREMLLAFTDAAQNVLPCAYVAKDGAELARAKSALDDLFRK